MKITVTEKEKEKDIEFPCLMYYDDHDSGRIIILATSKSNGMYSGIRLSQKIGEEANNWSSRFKPFNGTITLQND